MLRVVKLTGPPKPNTSWWGVSTIGHDPDDETRPTKSLPKRTQPNKNLPVGKANYVGTRKKRKAASVTSSEEEAEFSSSGESSSRSTVIPSHRFAKLRSSARRRVRIRDSSSPETDIAAY